MTAAIVVRGRPADAELAALTAVLLARPAAAEEPAPRPRARHWGTPRERLRLAPSPGPDAWRTSFRH